MDLTTRLNEVCELVARDSSNNIISTNFDTAYSLLLKWSVCYYQTPSKYTRIVNPKDDIANIQVTTIFNDMNQILGLIDENGQYLSNLSIDNYLLTDEFKLKITEDIIIKIQDWYHDLNIENIEYVLYLVLTDFDSYVNPSIERRKDNKYYEKYIDILNYFRFIINEEETQFNLFLSTINTYTISDSNMLNNDIDKLNKTILYINNLESEYNDYYLGNINNVNGFKITPINYTSSISLSNPRYNGKVPVIDDGIDIFDGAILSGDLPYILYYRDIELDLEKLAADESEVVAFNKMWVEKNIQKIPDYQKLVKFVAKKKKKNIMYFKVWGGEGEWSIDKIGSHIYFDGEYDLEENLLKFESPLTSTVNEDVIKNRIEKALGIEIGDYREESAKGNFTIFNADLQMIPFYFGVINNDFMYNYIYTNERETPFASKKTLDLHFKSSEMSQDDESLGSSIDFTVAPMITQGSIQTLVLNQNWSPDWFEFQSNIPYIFVNITYAINKESINRFELIFSMLLHNYLRLSYNNNIYSSYQLDVISDIVEYVGDYSIIYKSKKDKSKKSAQRIDPYLLYLKETWPHIFHSTYGTLVQKHRPTIINPEDINNYSNQTFEYNGKWHYRQVMQFPPDQPEIYLVCLDPKAPFPHLKKNTNEFNKGKYPYLPSCAEKDHMSDSSSTYNKWMTGNLKDIKKAERKIYIVKGNKAQNINEIAELPEAITKTVEIAYGKPGNIYRKGVYFSPNSFLHALAYIFSYTYYEHPNVMFNKYFNYAGNFDTAEEYVKKLRIEMSNDLLNGIINPEVMKQELFDLSNDEIIQQVRNTDSFFDPLLYYRLCEEKLNINIFIFGPSNDDDKVKSKKKINGTLLFPRSKNFHIRLNRTRHTVLIYRHKGSKADNLEYPHCEIILVSSGNDYPDQLIFDPNNENVNRTLYDLYLAAGRTSSMRFIQNRLKIDQNLFLGIDFYKYITEAGETPYYQYIDNAGKMRGLILKNGLSIIFDPSQPENLPTAPIEFKTEITYQMVNELFSPDIFPRIYASYNDSNMIDGLWIRIELTQSNIRTGDDRIVYIPIKPIDPVTNGINLQKGLSNPILPVTSHKLDRIDRMRNTLIYFLQIVDWLFVLSRVSSREFIDRYLVIDNRKDILDTSKIYDFTRMRSLLPDVTNVNDAIRQLQIYVPSMIHNGKISLYNQNFYDKIVYHIRMYEHSHEGLNVRPKRRIGGLIYDERYFMKQPNTSVFIGLKSFNSWVEYLSTLRKISISEIVIATKIDDKLLDTRNPYFLYNYVNKNYYIVQNVKDSDFQRALSVSIRWRNLKINYGYDADIESNNDVPYIIYEMDLYKSDVKVLDNRNVNMDILPYNLLKVKSSLGEYYSALLELV